MRRLALIGLTLAAFLSPSLVGAKTVSAFGIRLQRCVVLENAAHTEVTGVNVVYYNTHDTPATEVDFLVQYHGKNYTLTDTGSFTHFAQVDHTLTGAIAGTVWQGDTPDLCTPGRVMFANGKVLQ
ncbi:MAG TPA: hypothetical protein VGI19_09100 [Candidatus Cybelea sp.]